ncbi:MAG: zf-HC2 domain-containing protein [Acidimicrobiales bacterium]
MDRVIGCGEAVERLWEFLDHELDDRDHQAIEAHLAFCRRCCGELEFAKQLRRLLRAKSSGELPAAVRGRLDQFIGELAHQTGVEGER